MQRSLETFFPKKVAAQKFWRGKGRPRKTTKNKYNFKHYGRLTEVVQRKAKTRKKFPSRMEKRHSHGCSYTNNVCHEFPSLEDKSSSFLTGFPYQKHKSTQAILSMRHAMQPNNKGHNRKKVRKKVRGTLYNLWGKCHLKLTRKWKLKLFKISYYIAKCEQPFSANPSIVCPIY